jgi:uncharacterized protein (TIGR02145 family)
MGKILFNGTEPAAGKIKFGSQNVDRIYHGSTLIFPSYACTLGDVVIGTQTWMGCNLDVDTYRNGDPIPEVNHPNDFFALTTGAWCYYNADTANGVIYGKLYNWYAVNDPRGLAPEGYHIPSNEEFTTLADYLGGYLVAGGKMKQTGTDLWASPNEGATNTSGFTSIPGGYRSQGVGFNSLGYSSYYWTSTNSDSSQFDAIYRFIGYSYEYLGEYYSNKETGFSVRLIKDATAPPEQCTGYSFANKTELQTAVDLWESDRTSAIATYGEINTWCTGNVTDMAALFRDKISFNDSISNWNVSNVTDMAYMFSGAGAFNQDINSWNVSNVTKMFNMFEGATSFNGDISSWDVSSVDDMQYMFQNAYVFNQDISGWNVSSVGNMKAMFSAASVFNQNISAWDVSNVTDMSAMFYGSDFNQDIGLWNVSSVTNMVSMFTNATSFNQDLTNWCVTNITSEPSNFSFNSPLTEANKPIWGTCPP